MGNTTKPKKGHFTDSYLQLNSVKYLVNPLTGSLTENRQSLIQIYQFQKKLPKTGTGISLHHGS